MYIYIYIHIDIYIHTKHIYCHAHTYSLSLSLSLSHTHTHTHTHTTTPTPPTHTFGNILMRTNNKIDILARTEELSNIRPKGSDIFASRIAMYSSRHFWANQLEIGRIGEWVNGLALGKVATSSTRGLSCTSRAMSAQDTKKEGCKSCEKRSVAWTAMHCRAIFRKGGQ